MCHYQTKYEFITQLIELKNCISIELPSIIQYVLHFRTKDYEITSTKTYSFNVFQQ
jgi:hypothetical protein